MLQSRNYSPESRARRPQRSNHRASLYLALWVLIVSMLQQSSRCQAFQLQLPNLQLGNLKRCSPRTLSPSPLIRLSSSSSLTHSRDNWNWEGDDRRWSTRFSRRFRQSLTTRSTSQPAKTSLLIINTILFIYQTISTVNAIRRQHPAYWPSQAGTMVLDSLLGASVVPGRLTTDFIHSTSLSARQPHRYLTAGFLHGGLVHFLLNMDALRRMPSWLETGLGSRLFVTTFLASIVAGNLAFSFFDAASGSFCLGASGGLTGLYGLMYVCLVRMGNPSSAARVLRGMVTLFFYGLCVSNISNAGHVGGFIGGCIVGILCGPKYEKSYSMRRKWSLDVDGSPEEYRRVMGFGTKPSKSGWVPLSLLWAIALLGLLSQPHLRAAPELIFRGLVAPGSVSSALLR